MAKAKHTYAVRLAVEGGNKVKAELVSVGDSGERSLKKIERAGSTSEQAYDRMLRASDDWSDGVVRALRDYARESSDAATQFEQATTRDHSDARQCLA